MAGCCGLGTCVDPRCYLCQTVAKLPQPPEKALSRMERNPRRSGVAKKPSRDPVFTPRKRKALR